MLNALVSPSWLAVAAEPSWSRVRWGRAAPHPCQAAPGPQPAPGEARGCPHDSRPLFQWVPWCHASAVVSTAQQSSCRGRSRALAPARGPSPGSRDEPSGGGCVPGGGQGGGRQSRAGRCAVRTWGCGGWSSCGPSRFQSRAAGPLRTPHCPPLSQRPLGSGGSRVKPWKLHLPYPPTRTPLTSLGGLRELGRVQAVSPRPFPTGGREQPLQPPTQAPLLITQPILGLPGSQLLLLQPLRGSRGP